ncbi:MULTISPECIES: PLD nuclease N-terminal domain-containing protein [Exiguobacterium]|uniref:PLD nuclease N-terminal domain-containing protein n=1 Tax=Exiguobacterium alkaliphilum TaxID=1428684 RepID=A0ABT2KZ87_9BACL|nr:MULTISPECIES: PLD nuclease N-terminal domain-containing protein [Exiguobacterium]MCT4795786.1 PLD nuclease N-terminal domain-containing protein [Exiguobacterium alkaliphilum]QUE87324.1 PLDc_N domain-containing protein [Exiguobacterium alkaliphilum]
MEIANDSGMLLLILLPLLILQLVLLTFALIDLFKRNETNGPKWVWLLVILFMNILGPIIYFLWGRTKR